jgi:hypothetical protein
MKIAVWFLLRAFHVLSLLHPRQFRDEFGVEMQAVFEARITATGSGLEFLGTVLHEYVGLISSIVRERAVNVPLRRGCMKYRIATSASFLLLGIVLLNSQLTASYFCNLARPADGGIVNQTACNITIHGMWNMPLTTTGFAALCLALGVAAWIVFPKFAHSR